MASTNHQVFMQRLAIKEDTGPVFIDGGGNYVDSVSVSPENHDSTNFIQIPAGTVLAKSYAKKLFFPLAVDAATAATNNNTVAIKDSLAFLKGDIVLIGTEYRLITSVNYETNVLTFSGSAVNVSVGDLVECDRSRGQSVVLTTVTSDTFAVVDASSFIAGNVVSVGSTEDLNVLSVDLNANTITVDASATRTAGDLVVGNQTDDYRIAIQTVNTYNETFTPGNVLMPCRVRGRVQESNIRGLTSTAKQSLTLITFDKRS